MTSKELVEQIEQFEKLFDWDRKDESTAVVFPAGWYVRESNYYHTVTSIAYHKTVERKSILDDREKYVGSLHFRNINGEFKIEVKRYFRKGEWLDDK